MCYNLKKPLGVLKIDKINALILEMHDFDAGEPELIERVSFLIAHHHTYTDIDRIDYQILVEADFLVNLYENGNDKASIKSTYEKIFKTEAARRLCSRMFLIES